MAGPHEPLYPNPLEADVKKSSPEFGLSVLKSCFNRWKNGYGTETWKARVDRFERNRKYAAGRQDTQQYKDIVNVDGQIAVLNLDYSAQPIAIPFLSRLKDRYMQRVEKIRCAAIDPFTQNKKREAKENERFKMNYADRIKQIQGEAGVELEQFSEDDPKTEDDLNIKFGFNHKEKEEIIMELGVGLVFYENDWDDVIKDRIIDDICNCGFAVVNTELDGNGRIKTPFVKPEYFITSYSEFTDFRDWQYQGQLRQMSIMEIRLRFPSKLSEKALFDLAQKNAGQYGNASWSYTWNEDYNRSIARPWDGYTVQVVDMHYKTLYNLKYEKKVNSFGREILKKVTEIKPEKEYETSNPYYVAYHGVMVADSDILLKWELARNMLKPNDNLTEVLSPYRIFMHNNVRCSNTPLVETMIPSIDLMHNLHYKTLQIIAATAPDGADIDVSRLSDIDMGSGVGVVSPLQLYGIFLQTGNRYFKGLEDDSGVNMDGRPPISPNNFQYSTKLEQLDNKWQREYEKLQQMVGSSNLDAGVITNQATANSTLNNAKSIAASSSNYIYNSYLNIKKGVAKNIMMLLWDKFVYGEKSFDGYTMAIGKDNIEYLKLEATDDFEKTNFDVKIEAVIDDAEMEKLDRRVEIALANKEITMQDAIEIDLIDNPRYKAVMLATRAKKKYEADMKQNALNSKNNTDQAIAAAQEKSKGDLALEQKQFDNQMLLKAEENKGKQLQEGYQFAGILKGKVVDALLKQPGATIDSIPDFIWDGLAITNDAQKQLMLAALQRANVESQQQDQVLQQQAMQEQQQAEQPQGDVPMEQQQQLPQVA